MDKKLLTVDQYLRKAMKDEAVSDLIRKLHKTKIMSFADWEKAVEALLKKNIW
jgi:ABC-type Fe3+/spermidine/putrescine transport system ATPase subunit